MSNTENSLKNEKSRYLKQHADNPIHWWSWSKEAFDFARKEKKPILISIGYSSCHWCHVMNEQNFSQESTAEFFNQEFVNIKVDREEYPDVDHYYQTMSQELKVNGGWPLNVFLTYDNLPIFIGTFFSAEDSENRPSFLSLGRQILEQQNTYRDKIETEGKKVLANLGANPKSDKKVEFEGDFPNAPSIIHALKEFEDETWGGYGEAPKFPLYSYYEWAIEHIMEGVVPEELGKHIILSTEKMFMGGMVDQVRGGVHRYSTDNEWLIPHFEKMLYDQSGYLRLLSKLSLVYPSPLFIDQMILTLDYLKNELQSSEGYFFSSQSSDSEGVEGLYFCFSQEEFDDALNNFDEKLGEEKELFYQWFNIKAEGNFQHKLNAISINFEKRKDIFQPENWEKVRKVKEALLEERKTRIPPSTDNKGVASWNFMLISALCDVIQFAKIETLHREAQELLKSCLEGVHQTFLIKSEDGKTKIKHSTTRDYQYDYFEDYVFFTEAHTRLYSITGDDQFKHNALQTLQFIHQNFYKDGVFYSRTVEGAEDSPVPNIHYPFYDRAFRSAASTYLTLCRKWMPVTKNTEQWQEYESMIEHFTNFILYNPLSYGEGLRSMVYPTQAYKRLHIPRSWLKEQKLMQLMPHFSARFIFDYHDNGDQWEVGSTQEVEISGNGLEDFFQQITGGQGEASPDGEQS
jgi:uncharacterized protein YyaL (SSP411 family)